MRILLDTHILLWWLGEPARIPEKSRKLIAAPQNTVYISAVSLWEIRLKQSLGKLRVPKDFEKRLSEESFEDLPLQNSHSTALLSLPWHHRDPFDRMLIAQARAEKLQFLTADVGLAAYGKPVFVAD